MISIQSAIPFFKRCASTLFLIWFFLVFSLVMILVLPFILIISATLNGKKAHNASFPFLRFWGWMVSIFCFFPIRSKNRDIYDQNKSYIFISNHSSYLDSVAIVVAVPQPFKALGIMELDKVPLFGMIYRRLVVMIDRKSLESRKKCELALQKELSSGQSILIFPEGTINNGDELVAKFYDGAFRLAIETGTPLAPFVILNAGKLFSLNHPFDPRPGHIDVVFLKPIPVCDLTLADIPTLKLLVYELMKKAILEHNSALIAA